MAGIGMMQIAHPHVWPFGQFTNPMPEIYQTDRSGVDLWVVEYPINAAPQGETV